jgi:molecular chaperone DnaK
MSFAVGIDLGTTNTVVGAVRDGVACTVADRSGRRLLPSTISFHPSGKVLVGYPAVDRRVIDPDNTVYSIKRLIGRAWSSEEVQRARHRFPFVMKEGPKFGTLVVARGEEYTLPELSAFVLRAAKAMAEESLGAPVERAVITVPANFNDLQRAATKVAGKLAGLEVLRMLNEPTAAALAYGQGSDGVRREGSEKVAIYDLGGGTFDVTILELSGTVFEVLSTAGDTALGGDDIDAIITDRIVEEMLKKHRYDARTDPIAYGRLRIVAESIKRELSKEQEARFDLNDLVFDQGKTIPFSFRMTRAELEWASLRLVDRTFQVCQGALDRAGLAVDDMDRVILVGGATRMPIVARRAEQFFRQPPFLRVNPDEVVALGAALQVTALEKSGPRMARISPDSIAPARPSARTHPAALPLDLPLPMVEPNEPSEAYIPISVQAPESLHIDLPGPGRALVFDMDSLPAKRALLPPPPTTPPPPPPAPRPPPPAPALPPPPASAPTPVPPSPPPVTEQPPLVLSRPPLLIDVTPLSLCVETVGGFCNQLIECNTPVPCDRSRVFSTASDGQTVVFVRVAQGESDRFTENAFLGELELSGLTPAPRGELEIVVIFEIDADGILNVRAQDGKTGRETRARLHAFGAQHEEHELAAMQERQARHTVE